MIIKIEDLPKDRNIKKVSFDIEFEDGGVNDITPQIEDPGTPTINNSTVYTGDMSVFKSGARKIHEEMSKDSTVERPEIPEKKEHKAVPSEMTDMEF